MDKLLVMVTQRILRGRTRDTRNGRKGSSEFSHFIDKNLTSMALLQLKS